MERCLVVLFVLGLLVAAVAEEGPKIDCEFTINNLRHAVHDVSDWQTLGLELGLQWKKVKSLRDSTLSYDSRKVAMLQTWLDYDLGASWKKLSGVLDQMEQYCLATKIRDKCIVKSTTDQTEDCDTSSTDRGTDEEAMIPPPWVLAAASIPLIMVCLLCFGRGAIILVPLTGIALMVIITIYVHDTPETSSPQKPLLHCKQDKIAPNNLPVLMDQFLGRSDNVEDITKFLVNSSISCVRAVGIYGSPAVGKSTLAIQTAHVISRCGIEVRYIDLFDTHQLFERSSESNPLISSDSGASTETPDDSISLSAHGLLEWAKGVKKDSLLVLDNCDNILGIEEHGQKLKELITNILKQSSSKLRLIITSRQKMVIPGFRKYYLGELDNDSAVQLLQLRSNYLLSENDCKRIAALVDNNPLALHICANLVDETYPPNQLIAELKDTPMDSLSADILPESRKMVQVLYLSYKHLHNTTCSCGHYLSLFPGSFAEEAAIGVLSKSQFSDPKGCLEKLRDRSLIRPYELAGQLRYQHHRLVKEFFNYKLKDGDNLEFGVVVKKFQASFQWYYSGQLYDLAHSYMYTYIYRKEVVIGLFDFDGHNLKTQKEIIGRFEFDSHNFITLLELVAIHPPLSIESVVKTAHSLVNSDLVLNNFAEIELFRSLKAISLVLLYNNNEVVPILGNKLAGFWDKIFTRLHTIALSSTTFSECKTLCMETYEFPSNATAVLYGIMATEPGWAMHYNWLVCWSGVDCLTLQKDLFLYYDL